MTIFFLCIAITALGAQPPVPTSADPRIVVELVAAEPEIVTPIGITRDGNGGLLVIESHTHFRPPNYAGPMADRIRHIIANPADGLAGPINTFWEGSHSTMGIGRHPNNGWLYVATRDDLFRLKDTTGDGRADWNEPLVSLKSADKYPHSGLSGFAFDANGDVYFGFGENHAKRFELTGSDGKTLRGLEGGHIYRMSDNGKQLARVAIGCWNPFHLTFDAFGRLFTVDNDPDSRPPCRLLHVVAGADYGYKYRNGRKGTHPFTAWNGELPGTLPMVAGTGEAPSGMWACGMGDKLPADYRGDLLVTSWGDHRIERYRLKPHGASFAAERIDLIAGGEDFRPVGICAGDDGNLYVTDWADRSYDLHGKGRIWRLRTVAGGKPTHLPNEVDLSIGDDERRAEQLRTAATQMDEAELWRACDNTDPWIVQAARQGLKQRKAINAGTLLAGRAAAERRAIACMWHELNLTGAQRRLLELLSDPDPAVRIIALRWIGEERLTRLRPELPRVFTAGSMTQNVFACYLAAVEKLDSPPRRDADEWASDDYLARMLAASDADPTLIAMALRAIEPHHPVLTAERCEHWLASDHSAIKREAVRTLRETQSLERQLLLSRLVRDEQLPEDLRAEAAVGLTAESSADTQKLLALAGEVPDSVAAEVLRGLVGTPLNEQHQQPLAALAKRSPALAELAQRLLAGTTASPMPDVNDLDAWVEIAKQPSDAAVGGRIFYQKKLAMCGKCHQMQGRGGRIGPDLTMAASQLELRRLIESIIHPSREIAPHFVTWGVRTTDGRQLVGQLLDELPDGTQSFANAQGEMFALKPSEIGERQALATSIMPEGLAANLTRQEFADLIAFLRQSHRP